MPGINLHNWGQIITGDILATPAQCTIPQSGRTAFVDMLRQASGNCTAMKMLWQSHMDS